MVAAAGAGVATMQASACSSAPSSATTVTPPPAARAHGGRRDPQPQVGAAVEQRVSERGDEGAETVTERHEVGAPTAARGGAQAAHQPPAAGERADRLGHERLGAQIVAAPRVDSADYRADEAVEHLRPEAVVDDRADGDVALGRVRRAHEVNACSQ
jgi:hypothetical protein